MQKGRATSCTAFGALISAPVLVVPGAFMVVRLFVVAGRAYLGWVNADSNGARTLRCPLTAQGAARIVAGVRKAARAGLRVPPPRLAA